MGTIALFYTVARVIEMREENAEYDLHYQKWKKEIEIFLC